MSSIQICFTGIAATKRIELEDAASSIGFHVKKNTTKQLHILVVGKNAGASKLGKASDIGSIVLEQHQFEELLEVGYLPVELMEQLECLLTRRDNEKNISEKKNNSNDKILLNQDAQPVGRFNDKSNKQKALHSLKGILIGVSCDKTLKNSEVLFLDIWLKSHDELFDDPDTIDLMDAISSIVNNQEINEDDYEDILCLIEDVLEYKNVDEPQHKDQINTLLGILNGISADNEINEREIRYLKTWLENNQNIVEAWPASIISSKIIEILSDGEITQNELAEFIQIVQQVTGVHFQNTGAVSECSSEYFDCVSEIVHNNSNFCFTGKFHSGSRPIIENIAKSLGATTSKNIKTSTNYLVIGSLASRDWAYSSHGRKIEAAMKWKTQGYPISIISEEQWIKTLPKK